MAKTRQQNLNDMFGSIEKLNTKLDKLSVTVENLDTKISSVEKGSAEEVNLINKKNKAVEEEIKTTEEVTEAKKEEAKSAEEVTEKLDNWSEAIIESAADASVGFTQVEKMFGEAGGNLVKAFEGYTETVLSLGEDDERADMGKKIISSVGDIIENIANAPFDEYKGFDREASDKKRKELEKSGATDADLDLFDSAVEAAEATDMVVKQSDKLVDSTQMLGKQLSSTVQSIPLIGGFLDKHLQKGLTNLGNNLKTNLLKNINLSNKGTKNIGKGFTGTLGPIRAMGAAIGTATGGITILLGLLIAAAAALIGMAKRARDFAGEANIGFMQSVKLQGEFLKADAMLVGTGKSAKDIAKQMIDNYGTLANVNANSIKQIGQLSTRFGVATDDLIKFQKGFTDVTGASADVANDVVRAVGEMASGAGVAAGSVIKDIAGNMEAFARFSQDGASGMAKAAIEAAKIGSSLGEVVKVADSLLNFEQSITSEFEAQVLTGKNLNLERARAAALQGDFATLTAEIQQQVGGLGNLQAMNVIQKDAIAGALGLTVSELTKIARGEAIEDEESPELKEQKRTNQILIDGFTGNKEALDNIGKKSSESSGGMFGDFL